MIASGLGLRVRMPWLPGERFLWDTASLRVTNSEKANRFVDPGYRAGYGT